MRRSHLVAGGIVAFLALLAALLAIFWPSGHHSHRATCWGHAYASSHRQPGDSFVRRHGKGPVGVDVCDP